MSDTPRTDGVKRLLDQLGRASGETYFALKDGIMAGVEQLADELNEAKAENARLKHQAVCSCGDSFTEDAVCVNCAHELRLTIDRLRVGRCPNLLPVINWLENGCAVNHAVNELKVYQATYFDAAMKAKR